MPVLRKNSIRQGSTFHFLHQQGSVAGAADWDRTEQSKLWRYNLHYFDWLRERAAPQRVDDDANWINRWIAENPAGRGTGWEPYPLSLRVVNWITWMLTIGPVSSVHIESLANQARHLEGSVEFHLLGNHLFANAKALVFAGAFFEGSEANRWRTLGLDLLTNEISEQILADGGHFELSPMYHALILEDVLDLLGLGRVYPSLLSDPFASLRLQDAATRMLHWLQRICHPDGEIPYFNDAAFGIAPAPADLAAYAATRAIAIDPGRERLTLLPSAGYAVFSVPPFHCVFDCGRIGPDYLPGHAHADTLAIEISVGRERLISNSGTSTYERGSEREWERSTQAHATIEIDGMSSAETWASFRVGRRPNVSPVATGANDCPPWAECQHDGYAHLPGSPIHHRRVTTRAEDVQISDRIEGSGCHSAVGLFPIHPGVRAAQAGDRTFRLTTPEGHAVDIRIDGPVQTEIRAGRFAPTFGITLDRPVIAWRWAGELPLAVRTRFRLATV